MCITCWRECGEPKLWNERCERAAEAVERLYENEPTGGAMHIVTDDWNVEDDNIRWCLDSANHDPGDITPEAQEVGERFLALNMDERRSVLAVESGLWEPGEGGLDAS